MSQPKLVQDREPASLEQIFGSGEGRVFPIDRDSLTIGRGDQNDVVLASSSVSRTHAIIERDFQGNYTIRDNGSKNGIVINSETVQEAVLKDGDVFQIGDFAFRFKSGVTLDRAPLLPVVGGASGKLLQQLGNIKGKKKKKSGQRSMRPLIYGLVGISLVAVLMMNEETPSTTEKAPEAAFSTEKTADSPYVEVLDPTKAKAPSQRQTGLEDPTKTQAENELGKMEWDNTGLKESEQYFRMGRREYASKNYQRAIRLFQTSISFDRQHPLSNFYLQLAVAEVEKDAKVNANIGLQYFNSLQYDRAIYHFKQAISLMAHRPNSETVTRAKEYIKIATERMRAAELFP